MSIAELRSLYHRKVCENILHIKDGVPNIADSRSKASTSIALLIIERLDHMLAERAPAGQTAGDLFELCTKEFLENSFELLRHLRPGKWLFSVNQSISQFEQYEHLADIAQVFRERPDLAAALGGDYIITPDIIVGRQSVTDAELNQNTTVVSDTDLVCQLTPLRAANRQQPIPILHASISCKWTIRSDRAQNIRTEGLNLIRNRKGHTPHIAAVTAEPLPTRLASLALGTGDLDCVYHFALPELRAAVEAISNEDQMDILTTMINGRRLRDISDLPLDLAI
ncbi:MAG: restriction endonuclease [Chloroflexi bacterium]|nr:restriction endonuclease [Chloroflexota bacterium]